MYTFDCTDRHQDATTEQLNVSHEARAPEAPDTLLGPTISFYFKGQPSFSVTPEPALNNVRRQDEGTAAKTNALPKCSSLPQRPSEQTE